jgi:hypothetical protein
MGGGRERVAAQHAGADLESTAAKAQRLFAFSSRGLCGGPGRYCISPTVQTLSIWVVTKTIEAIAFFNARLPPRCARMTIGISCRHFILGFCIIISMRIDWRFFTHCSAGVGVSVAPLYRVPSAQIQ